MICKKLASLLDFVVNSCGWGLGRGQAHPQKNNEFIGKVCMYYWHSGKGSAKLDNPRKNLIICKTETLNNRNEVCQLITAYKQRLQTVMQSTGGVCSSNVAVEWNQQRREDTDEHFN